MPVRFESTSTSSPCTLCGGFSGTVIADRDRDGKPFTVVCCSSCGLARVEPLPTQDALARFYAERYRLEYKQASRPSGRHIVRAARIAAERIAILCRLLPKGGRLLDCGAGGGEFVYLAGRNGFSPLDCG